MKPSILKYYLSLVIALCTLSASAYDFMVGGIAYNIKNSNEVAVTFTSSYNYFSNNYSNLTGDLVIPVTVTYNEVSYLVTSIGDGAFSHCSGLTSVTIGNSVTSIGMWAFNMCALTSLHIPNSVTTIGHMAFAACGSPTSVNIPNSVTYIGEKAFMGCNDLTNIVVEEGNDVYDSRSNCNAIIETASNTLIAGCKTTIIPNSVSTIGNSAFSNCSGLTSVAIPNSVSTIGNSAFSNCSGLTSVAIPNSVTSIGAEAFFRCSGLTSVTIGNSVKSIGMWAFRYCSGLTSATIPNSVTSIGAEAFSNCSGLKRLQFDAINCTIGDNAFSFVYLSNLILGEQVERIPAGLPWPNMSGKTLVLPNSVRMIDEGALQCTCNAVIIGDLIESIATGAFSNDVEVAYVSSMTPLPCSAGAFANPQTLYVPAGCKGKYLMSDGWCEFADIVEGSYIRVTDLSLDMDSITMQTQATLQLNAMVLPTNHSAATPEWWSSNTAVATVDSTGLVMAVALGEVDIWCTIENKTVLCHIFVLSENPVIKLMLDMDSVTMQKQATLQLNATWFPCDAIFSSMEWRSSNPSIASVSATGLVTAYSEGETDIYCTIDNKTAICHITVVENHIADSIQLNYTDLLLDWDNIVDLTATVLPESVDQSVTWTIPENDNIYARVVGNKLRVMAMRSGSVTVTATSVADPSVSADCVITIQIPDVNGDTSLNIADVTALIDYLLGGDSESINIGDADVNRDGNVNIADVTALIDKLLSRN